jgi:hypothetical protein
VARRTRGDAVTPAQSLQLPLFDLGPFNEPDTLTKAAYYRLRRAELDAAWRNRRQVEVRLAEPPPSVVGRPWQDVVVSGGRL